MSEEQKLQEVKERNYQCALKLCKALDIYIVKELEDSIDDTECIVYRIIENLFSLNFENSMRERIEKKRKYYMYYHLLHIREEMGRAFSQFDKKIIKEILQRPFLKSAGGRKRKTRKCKW